ncbi:23S rRNA (uracil(1939)-C(5))-methyltransferase RlmD [bacterium]|nr:23S rRNA (uracil(1939)-C(5))-methyltransferase RlmD [bacterium]
MSLGIAHPQLRNYRHVIRIIHIDFLYCIISKMNPDWVGKKITVECRDLGQAGEGIGKHGGVTVFVPGLLPGEQAEVTIKSISRNYVIGELNIITKVSVDRNTPPCPHFNDCGGCQVQHLSYPGQLAWKRMRVESVLQRIGGVSAVSVPPVLGDDSPWQYRNKAMLPVGTSGDGKIQIGCYRRDSHEIIDIDECLIQHPASGVVVQKIRQYIRDARVMIYDESKRSGSLRHILIRNGESGMVVILVSATASIPDENGLLGSLKKIPGISGVGVIHNASPGNTVLTGVVRILFGSQIVTYRLAGLTMTAPATSFFQINTAQIDRMLPIIKSWIRHPHPVIFDLYCGAGTFGLAFANLAKAVYGCEITPESIKIAIANAEANQISNCRFEAGDSENVTRQWIASGIRPDVIIVDPPRKGCSPEMIRLIRDVGVEELIYVSCDPATMARDLKALAFEYEVTKIQPFDMFPQTTHVETAVHLQKRHS